MAECTTCQHKKVCKYVEQYVSAGIKVKETVHECVDYAPTAEWIDVNERLPEKNVRVLVYLKSGYTRIDTDRRIDDGQWVRWGNNVTHWMPLPEPPKGEVENG